MSQQNAKKFPSFRLPLLTGGELTSDIFNDQIASLVVFFKIDCDASRLVVNLLQNFWDRLPDHSHGLYLIAQDEADTLRKWVQEKGISLPLAIDAPDFRLSRTLAFTFVPALYLVDSSGNITNETNGFVKTEFKEIINQFLQKNNMRSIPVFEDEAQVPELRPG